VRLGYLENRVPQNFNSWGEGVRKAGHKNSNFAKLNLERNAIKKLQQESFGPCGQDHCLYGRWGEAGRASLIWKVRLLTWMLRLKLTHM